MDRGVSSSLDEVNMRMFWRTVVAQRKFVFKCVIGAVVLMSLFLLIAQPRYDAETKLLVENQETSLTQLERASTGAIGQVNQITDEPGIVSQVEVLLSPDLMRPVYQKLMRESQEKAPSGLLSRFVSFLTSEQKSEKDGAQSKADKPIEMNESDLSAFIKRFQIVSIPKSRVLAIRFTASDPQMAARAPNLLADAYIQAQVDVKKEAAHRAVVSLLRQMNDLKMQASQAAETAERYRAEKSLLVGPNNAPLNAQQLADLNAQLTSAQAAQSENEAKSQLIRKMLNQGRLQEISDIAKDETVRRLAEQLAALRAQMAFEGQTYLPAHPRMKELSAQYSTLAIAFKRAAETAAKNLENDVDIARARYNNLKSTLEKQTNIYGGASPDEAHARELDRNARLIQEQLEFVTQKYHEAAARESAGTTPSDARVIARAYPPQKPSFPKKTMMLLFAICAGLVLSIGFVTMRLFLADPPPQRPIYHPPPTQRDDEGGHKGESGSTNNPAGGGIRAMHGASESFCRDVKDIAMYLTRQSEKSGEAIGAMCGIMLSPGCAGRWEDALILGRGLSEHGRTILVDVREDVKGQTQGLSDLLLGVQDFQDVIRKDNASQLHLMERGQYPVVDITSFEFIAEVLKATYEYSSFCLSHLNESSREAQALIPILDCIIILCDPSERTQDIFEVRTNLLKAGGKRVFLMKADIPKQRAA